MIDWPGVRSVLDLGAGSEPMRFLLPQGVDHFPVDYKQLTGNTLIFDFNKKEFPGIQADVVILVGVNGYVDYHAWLIDRAVRALNREGQLIISLPYYKSDFNAFDLITEYKDVVQCVDYAFRNQYYGLFKFRRN